MKVVVAGASGLIGGALVPALVADGHDVVRLVRRKPKKADEVQWDPAGHEVDDAVIAGADAVINLAGAGIGDRRWTESYKQQALDSRVDSTTTLAAAAAKHASSVRVLLNASAVGWYGDRGDDVVTESDGCGEGFLADLVRQWEAATAPAEAAGVRVVRIRTGIVLSPEGGALGRMLPLFRLGVGGRLGSGKQWVPWIAIDDEIAAIRFLLANDEASGAFNLAAPNPVTNAELTKALGRALHRPTVAAVPPIALRLAFGGFADEGLLAGQRAVPAALEAAGFGFAHAELEGALTALLSGSRGPARTARAKGKRR
ncbi:MAG TPA: TIGR01777 family oxidoreductase [Mycobacteriales bacterium]|nr:TIGR01777 family oxidoreductase [Mycobacteriales bacterium]